MAFGDARRGQTPGLIRRYLPGKNPRGTLKSPAPGVKEPGAGPAPSDSPVGPPPSPGTSPDTGTSPVGAPNPPPTNLPLKGTYALPGTRAARGVRLAQGQKGAVDLQGQPFGSPGGNNQLLDYILERMRNK